MNSVPAVLITKKVPIFELTIPAMKGFNSLAPEYMIPITVVTQSMVPKRMMSKLGIKSFFRMGSPSPFSLTTT